MKTTRLQVSEATEQALRDAHAQYAKAMLVLYPIGSLWMCTHGTHGAYEVEIKRFDYKIGFVVENTKTHKIKRVHWSSLRAHEEGKNG